MFICFRQRAKNLQAPNNNKTNILTATTKAITQPLVKAKEIFVDKTWAMYGKRAQHQQDTIATIITTNKVLRPKRLTKKEHK